MTSPTMSRPPVPRSALDLLDRSRDCLVVARNAASPGERYVAAHLSALRAAAAVLAVRGRPRRPGGALNVWQVLPRVAPELGEWASFFSASALRRAAVEAGRSHAVSTREADDLMRDAEMFSHLVADCLGVSLQLTS